MRGLRSATCVKQPMNTKLAQPELDSFVFQGSVLALCSLKTVLASNGNSTHAWKFPQSRRSPRTSEHIEHWGAICKREQHFMLYKAK